MVGENINNWTVILANCESREKTTKYKCWLTEAYLAFQSKLIKTLNQVIANFIFTKYEKQNESIPSFFLSLINVTLELESMDVETRALLETHTRQLHLDCKNNPNVTKKHTRLQTLNLVRMPKLLQSQDVLS